MLESYIAAGLDPAAFWSLTPRLYLVHMTGASARLEREHKDRAWLAYHTAYLPDVKKRPKLEDLTGEPSRARRAKTWEQQLAAWEIYAATKQ